MTDGSADGLALAAEFPSATREQWRELAEHVLKGAAFERKLVAETYAGLRPRPHSAAPSLDASPARLGRSWRASTIHKQRRPMPRPCTISQMARPASRSN